MSLLTNINGVPLYSTIQEALNWAKVGEELGIALYKHLVKDRSIR